MAQYRVASRGCKVFEDHTSCLALSRSLAIQNINRIHTQHTHHHRLHKSHRTSHVLKSSLNNEGSESNNENNPLARSDIIEIDQDLYSVLELATDEELEQLYNGLYGQSLLSPLGKSLQNAEPPAIHYRGRENLIRRIEQRFRFLAADASSTLRGQYPSYRQALLAVHDQLKVPCPGSLATNDLEAEIFLFLLQEHSDAVDAATPSSPSTTTTTTTKSKTSKTQSTSYAAAVDKALLHGDGMAQPPSSHSKKPNIIQKILSPLKLGANEVVPAITKLGATVAVTNLHVNIARKLGTALVSRRIQYETALQMAVTAASRGAMSSMQGKVAVQAAQRGLTAAATRYAAARTVLSLVGPIMWASTFIDLARMSIGTDYSRVVKAVFMLAQIRLLRTSGWSNDGQKNE